MGRMETVVTVQARSEAEAERWLELLRTIGLEPVSAPKQPVGRDRWMVRARPATQPS